MNKSKETANIVASSSNALRMRNIKNTKREKGKKIKDLLIKFSFFLFLSLIHI